MVKRIGLAVLAGAVTLSAVAALILSAPMASADGGTTEGVWENYTDGAGTVNVWRINPDKEECAIDIVNPNWRNSWVFYSGAIDPENVTLRNTTNQTMTRDREDPTSACFPDKVEGGMVLSAYAIQIMNRPQTRFIWQRGGELDDPALTGYIIQFERTDSDRELRCILRDKYQQPVGEGVVVRFPRPFQRAQSFDYRFYQGKFYIDNIEVPFDAAATQYLQKANAQMGGSGYISLGFHVDAGRGNLGQFIVCTPRYYTDRELADAAAVRDQIDRTLPDTVTADNITVFNDFLARYQALSANTKTLINSWYTAIIESYAAQADAVNSDISFRNFARQMGMLKSADQLTTRDLNKIRQLEYMYNAFSDDQRAQLADDLKEKLYAAVARMEELTGTTLPPLTTTTAAAATTTAGTTGPTAATTASAVTQPPASQPDPTTEPVTEPDETAATAEPTDAPVSTTQTGTPTGAPTNDPADTPTDTQPQTSRTILIVVLVVLGMACVAVILVVIREAVKKNPTQK